MNNTEPVLSAFHIVNLKAMDSNDASNLDRILFCKTFLANGLVAGSFFSCIYNSKLRIHAVFNEKTDIFHNEISKLIEKSMKESKLSGGVIWIRTVDKSLIAHLSNKFSLTPDPEDFFYYSTEYIMHRNKFSKKLDNTLTTKPYEECHIDKYMEVLSDSMSFFVPPEDFVLEKQRYMQEFLEYNRKNAFEAFWKGNELVGLYWIDGIEVDTMGVSSNFQRLGYGLEILTKAIENVFQQNPETEYALLYCVGWNAKAQNFYKKYGMEIKTIHKVPYDVVNA